MNYDLDLEKKISSLIRVNAILRKAYVLSLDLGICDQDFMKLCEDLIKKKSIPMEKDTL